MKNSPSMDQQEVEDETDGEFFSTFDSILYNIGSTHIFFIIQSGMYFIHLNLFITLFPIYSLSDNFECNIGH